jgi:hypothetical protein
MKINKISAKQLKDKQDNADRRSKVWTLITLAAMILIVFIVKNLIMYSPDLRYYNKLRKMYGTVIPAGKVCMSGDMIKMHNTYEFTCNGDIFTACCEKCEKNIRNHFEQEAYTFDTVSGVKILKSKAIPGFRKKGEDRVIYFENMKTFHAFYQIGGN